MSQFRCHHILSFAAALAAAMSCVDLIASQPGQPAAQFNPTTATNLLSAQASLRNSQNSLLSVWLDYFAARLRLNTHTIARYWMS